MGTATVMLRGGQSYKREAFQAGLSALGYQLSDRHMRSPGPADVLVLWNRNRGFEGVAEHYERGGATVLIAENGYLPDPKERTFALAIGKHNGAGTFKPDRWTRYPIDIQPWRKPGRSILLLPQRGMGSPGVAMPRRWLANVKNDLAKRTSRPVKVRPHPCNACVPLVPDLVDVWACVTWASGAGIKAICEGVPVFYCMPGWIGLAGGMPFADSDIEKPFRGDRAEMIREISWAQWRLSEIASGKAFRHLLG